MDKQREKIAWTRVTEKGEGFKKLLIKLMTHNYLGTVNLFWLIRRYPFGS